MPLPPHVALSAAAAAATPSVGTLLSHSVPSVGIHLIHTALSG